MKNNSIIDKYILRVEELQKTLPPSEERKVIIENLNEEYYQEVGNNLPSFILEMLGTWFMQEVYSDKRTNKVAIEEFPILTESQLVRRRRKTVHIADEDTIEILNFHLRNNSSTSKREDSRTDELGGKHDGRY